MMDAYGLEVDLRLSTMLVLRVVEGLQLFSFVNVLDVLLTSLTQAIYSFIALPEPVCHLSSL